jgi:hypothetical protein
MLDWMILMIYLIWYFAFTIVSPFAVFISNCGLDDLAWNKGYDK